MINLTTDSDWLISTLSLLWFQLVLHCFFSRDGNFNNGIGYWELLVTAELPALFLLFAYQVQTGPSHCHFEIQLKVSFLFFMQNVEVVSLGSLQEWIFSNADERSACCQSISDISGCGSVEQGEWEHSEGWVHISFYKFSYSQISQWLSSSPIVLRTNELGETERVSAWW